MNKTKDVDIIAETKDLRDTFAELCDGHNLGVVMNALSALLIDTALDQAEVEPHELIGKFAGLVMSYVEVVKDEDEDESVKEALNEKGVLQWLN